MTKRTAGSMLVVAVALATACNQEPNPAGIPGQGTEPDFIPVVNPATIDGNQQGVQEPSKQDPEAWKEAGLIVFDLNRVMEKATGWKDAHEAIKRSLLEFDNHPFAYLIQQSIANKMLALHLLGENPTREMKEAIAFYTELLLRNKHPDASVLSKAIGRLEGFWTTEQRTAAATNALRFAASYLEKNPCMACGEKGKIRMEDLSARERKLFEMDSSMPSLAALAKSAH